MTISIERWGKDHWSTFGYLEAVCVDYGGRVDLRRMRTHPGRHPQYVAYKPMSGEPQDGSGFPTMLEDGQEQPDHDDSGASKRRTCAGLTNTDNASIRTSRVHPPSTL